MQLASSCSVHHHSSLIIIHFISSYVQEFECSLAQYCKQTLPHLLLLLLLSRLLFLLTLNTCIILPVPVLLWQTRAQERGAPLKKEGAYNTDAYYEEIDQGFGDVGVDQVRQRHRTWLELSYNSTHVCCVHRAVVHLLQGRLSIHCAGPGR
jgi:hypothetical protein